MRGYFGIGIENGKAEVNMKFCSKCGQSMVRADLYDPDGTIPLVVQIDGAEMWACIRCSKLAEAELKKGDCNLKEQERRIHEYNARMTAEVVRLCEQEGFGFVMYVAADEWRRRDPKAAHTAGPCATFTKPCDCKQRHLCDKCHGCGWQFKKIRRE